MSLDNLFDNLQWGLMLNVRFIDFLQMLIMTGVIFYLCKTLYRTRAWVLIKGLMIIGIAYLLVYATNMTVLRSIMEGLFSVLMISIVIMFQPDLQRLVENVGKKSITSTVAGILKKQPVENNWCTDKTIYEIVSACEDMSSVKTGALIVIERAIPLKEYVESGISIKAEVSNQLLINIFEKNTPLHDGAIVIRNNQIEAATCYLPLTTNESIDKHLGTRHRAAIGVSEATDCIVIVVSEETGAMSICVNGEIQHNIDRSKLSEELHKFSKKKDDKITLKHTHNTPMFLKIMAPVLSVLLCLFILNINDPVTTKTFYDVPVNIENEDVLLSKNQSYAIESGDEVSVTIKGHRSVVDNLTKNDIWATADMEELSIVYSIPVKITMAEKYARKVEIVPSSHVLKLALENLSQVEIPIEIEVEATNSSRLIAVSVNGSKTIAVTGSESVVKTLDKAVVTIDVSNKHTDFVETFEAVIYDKNGNLVPMSKLKLNNKVEIKGTAYSTKSVPLKVQLNTESQNAESYYELNSFETDVKMVKIAGEQEVLDTINSFDLIVSPDEGLETVTTMVFKLKNYLPENVYLGPGQVEEISVSVNITKYQTIKVPLQKENIIIKDANAEMETTLVQIPATIELIVNTSKIAVEEVTTSLIKPYITAKQEAGEYTSALAIESVDGITINSKAVVTYKVSEKEGE